MKVGGSISQSKQTDLGILQGGVLGVTLFLVTINSILGELENGMDGSFFADDLAIYIKTRNQRVVARAQEGEKVGYAAVFKDTTRRGALPEEASIH